MRKSVMIGLGAAWVAAVLVALLNVARADERPKVDALIITGIDISGSMESGRSVLGACVLCVLDGT